MSRRDKVVLTLALAWATLYVSYAVHRTPTLDTPSFLFTLLFGVALLFAFIDMLAHLRQRGPIAARTFALCIAIVFVAWQVIGPIRSALFAHALPSYEAVVSDIAAGRLPASTTLAQVPQAVPRAKMTWQVWQEKTESGVLMVEFDTERAFPVLHSGYLFSSSGVIEPGSQMSSRRPFQHKLRDHWFFVSD